MIRSTHWIPFTALALLVVFTFWLERLVRTEGGPGSKNVNNDPDVIIERFNASRMGPDGTLRFILSADRMTHYPLGDTARLEKVSFESKAPDQPRISAVAAGGTVTDGGDQVVMEGDVIVTADATAKAPAWRLTTQKLTVLPEQNLARSDSAVRFESQDMTLVASSFVLNTKTRVLDLKEIRATYLKPRS
jgi:lipopolysaccharide export system protein LptC